MRVIIANPGEKPEVREISGDSMSLIACVGGTPKHLANEGHTELLVNGDRKADDIKFHHLVILFDDLMHHVHGPVLVVGVNDAGTGFESLTDADVKMWMPRLIV